MFTLNCNGRLLVADKPLVMGILNVTPDSFFSGSRFQDMDALLRRSEQMLNEGATILDIGGQSTRPGSERITAEEELKRVIAPVETILKNFPGAYISIDTYFSAVAKEAIGAGASFINDISAGGIDETMIDTAASLHVPYVLMHSQGTLADMQKNPQYENITREVLDFFIQKTTELKNAGVIDIILDPGFGFGKTIPHNFQLLKNLSVFKMLERPVLAGISRKATIYKTLETTAEQALNGSTVLHTIGLMNGANILRVHDVKEAIEAIKLFEAYAVS